MQFLSFRRLNLLPTLGILLLILGMMPGIAGGQEEVHFEHDTLSIVVDDMVHHFTVEIAETRQQRARGLMFRRKMAPDAGMLFDYRRPKPVAMWMKNTYIPLDMLFIRADGSVESIRERAVPHSLASISSKDKVRAVLELNAGTAARLGIRPGDLVRHRIFGNAD